MPEPVLWTIMALDLPASMSEHDVEVSKLKRELRFFPVTNPRPKKLTAPQIQSYNGRCRICRAGVGAV